MIRENLSEAEFAMYQRLDEQTLKDYHEIFDIFDQDNDGHISCYEIKDIMHALGENPGPMEI